MKTNRNAAITPGSESGSVTRRKACQRLAPRSRRGLEQPPVEALERDEDRQRDERQPDVAEHEHDREAAVEQLRDRVVGRAQPGREEERVDHALVAEDHLPGEHAQQVARQERRDQQQQQDVLPLRPGEREVVRERVGERDDDSPRRSATSSPTSRTASGRSGCAGSRASAASVNRVRAGVERETADAVEPRRSRSGTRKKTASQASGRPSSVGVVEVERAGACGAACASGALRTP